MAKTTENEVIEVVETEAAEVADVPEKVGFFTKCKNGVAKVVESKPAKAVGAVIGGALLVGGGYLLGKGRSNSGDSDYTSDDYSSDQLDDMTDETV